MGIFVEQHALIPVDEKHHALARLNAFSYPREFSHNRFVYTVISTRARGLCVGINVNPDRKCNFDCLYCEVDRSLPLTDTKLNINVMATELHRTLADITHGKLRGFPQYQLLPEELLKLRHVTLSGDGEPTLAPHFAEVVEAVVHVRALAEFPFFKIVLLTNASGLDLPPVRAGLAHLIKSDEIWAKLDAGSADYLNKLARPQGVTLDKILSNILLIARQRPVVIQSLFPSINGEEPSVVEIDQYIGRLKKLKDAGAQISLVQIYSATRPTTHPECGHLPLRTLSQIALTVRNLTGLKAEVF